MNAENEISTQVIPLYHDRDTGKSHAQVTLVYGSGPKYITARTRGNKQYLGEISDIGEWREGMPKKFRVDVGPDVTRDGRKNYGYFGFLGLVSDVDKGIKLIAEIVDPSNSE